MAATSRLGGASGSGRADGTGCRVRRRGQGDVGGLGRRHTLEGQPAHDDEPVQVLGA